MSPSRWIAILFLAMPLSIAGCLPVPVTTFSGVSGRVVDAIDGHGIVGARVRVLSLRCAGATTKPIESLPVLAETKTTDDGFFYVAPVSEWRWILVFPIGDRAESMIRVVAEAQGYHLKTADDYMDDAPINFGRIELHR